jgi:hypothetical protein
MYPCILIGGAERDAGSEARRALMTSDTTRIAVTAITRTLKYSSSMTITCVMGKLHRPDT